MYALFEDGGKFLAGRVMSEADSSMQVELDSGKRVKVKAANVLLKFDRPAPAELIASAQSIAKDIDLDLAWEFASESEFGFADLAREYFNANTEADLRTVYENLTTELVVRNEKTELTAYATLAAAVLAVFAGAFSLLWFNRLP